MRRIFRRHIRKTLSQNIPPVLQEANFAFDKGEYGRAGELFENLAKAADARGGPRAPIFHLQAGRARILAGQTRLGMPSLKRGLQLLAQRGLDLKYRRNVKRVLSELESRGLKAEAAEITAWLNGIAPGVTEVDTEPPPARRPVLPTHCPSCGAAVRPDEVEWLDDVTAECGYCGSPIREAD